MYEIENVEEDENDRVMIHYVGYSERYDEWRSRDDITIRPDRITSVQEPITSPFATLACMIKKKLVPSREDPAIRIQLLFNHSDWQLLHNKSIPAGREFTINSYSDIDDLMGENWYYRVVNASGDFSYAVLETIRYHLFVPKPLLEYSHQRCEGKIYPTICTARTATAPVMLIVTM